MMSRPVMIGYLIVFMLLVLVFVIHQETVTRVFNEQILTLPQTLSNSTWLDGKSEFRGRLDQSVIKTYESQLKRRVALMKSILTVNNEWFGFAWLYNGIVPEVFCPSLVRVGNVDDGGKWICNPMAMPDECVIMSLGVNNDTTFEREIQHLTDQKCSIHAYDKVDPAAAIYNFEAINAFFYKAIITTEDDAAGNKRSVRGEMRRLGIERIEILKIDIEGTEFDVLPDLIKETTFCQILIEIHGKSDQVVRLIAQMARQGYRMFSYEINARVWHLSEYSFIHDDCLAQYEATPLVYYWHLVE